MGKDRKTFPALYATLYPCIARVAHAHGYALGLHGSMATDLDVIAVPWTESAGSADDLAEAIGESLGAWMDREFDREPGQKPHGRRAYTLILTGGAYVDLSIMPRKEPPCP